ncbi:MAG TPA: AAA family ATPase, partial [Anaerolineales bacterium]|nr:AAA family ATPase [Anaerolineales bacterium]
HPSSPYTYTFTFAPGRFLDFCARARTRTGACVLIIDEINRADLSRVFGELMVLLEYRNREITLASGQTFSIPANVRLLGTMNTADRSIALVDFALRRRFAFLVLPPNFDVLRRYHARHQTAFPVENLITLLQRVNAAIEDPNFALGQSFFLRSNLPAEIEDIWRTEIEPYLEEYFFDQPETVEGFRWERFGLKAGNMGR